ncbi:methyltransferase domain-containing protein [Bdellovibrio bacteriovorus]|uniref:class I SAM-dependent methyltransferase n=1 Tax=Bdellovibrio bacteriovorus TaxID=959 RepID=UPI0021D07A16|nr:methyltransferase domain-containing protein [Bdellovibrio bacteriovorus]UXR63944.1 methyltransferase domain-containing protein [Bdellovibrio bacteriovorus]
MKAQYQTFVNKAEETFSNILALNGLCDRDTALHLQAVVQEFYPQTFGLSALDLHSGRGVGAMALAEMGFNVAAYDMYRNSISILQRIALQQDLNISFGMGGAFQAEALDQKFDLIHDGDCLNTMINEMDQMQYLISLRNILNMAGKLVITVKVQSKTYVPEEGFESVRMDENHILWRQTPECDIPGVNEHESKFWTAHKWVPPVDVVLKKVQALGFQILSEDLEMVPGNNPAVLRLTLTPQLAVGEAKGA